MNINQLNQSADQVCELMTLLSNKNRLMILCHLIEEEMSVGQLAKAIDARETAVSQQLAVLRRERIVKARRQGQTMYYRIIHKEVGGLLEYLNAHFCGENTETETKV